MEFKGTKGKWVLINGFDENGKGFFPSVLIHGTEKDFIKSYGRNGITVNVSHDQKIESLMANALLISKAPEILEMLSKAKVELSRIKSSMMAHPDCTIGSEFDDYTSSAQECENEIELLIKEATEL